MATRMGGREDDTELEREGGRGRQREESIAVPKGTARGERLPDDAQIRKPWKRTNGGETDDIAEGWVNRCNEAAGEKGR